MLFLTLLIYIHDCCELKPHACHIIQKLTKNTYNFHSVTRRNYADKIILFLINCNFDKSIGFGDSISRCLGKLSIMQLIFDTPYYMRKQNVISIQILFSFNIYTTMHITLTISDELRVDMLLNLCITSVYVLYYGADKKKMPYLFGPLVYQH